jgi:hypothetical protein
MESDVKRKNFLYNLFPVWENSSMLGPSKNTEATIIKALADQVPFAQLPGIRVTNVADSRPFDVRFDLESGANTVRVYAEIKQSFSPRELENIAPWIARLKAIEKDAAFAVVSPALSQQAQNFCIEAGIDFLDLAGNISINVPGKFVIQRTGQRSKGVVESTEGPREVNVFSGRFSRVIRVLLQKPRSWTLSEIAQELERESRENSVLIGAGEANSSPSFAVSLGTISKALRTLEDQLWIRRRGTSALVPEPKRLLLAWAAKYRERYRSRLRKSITYPNPFGQDPTAINNALKSLAIPPFALTGPAAANVRAPFIDIDTIDIYLSSPDKAEKLKDLANRKADGPPLRFLEPYDLGVFMYSETSDRIPTVSDVQAYLDLIARGGRDQKQADYLFEMAIEPMWKVA